MSEANDIESIKERKKAELLNEETEEATTQTTTSPDEPIHVEDQAHFRSVVEDHDVVLVDFHADWCGPCKMLEPIVQDLAAETDAAIAKVDVDAHQQLAGQYGVRGVPTTVLFARGKVADQIVGVREKSHYSQLIERHSA